MKAELLAPAGSYESMVAAVMAGADAVYMGGTRFGARAFADNPAEDKMLEAIDFCHLHGVHLYLTVNTLLKDQELTELYQFLAPLYEHGLDAVIVQDFGVMQYIRRQFPKLDIHASTQMTNQGVDGAKFLEKHGVKRVVTSRELSLKEIHKIKEQTNLEIESFVHGALCYSYSGQCLLSSMIGGRSGNRGRCAQPCRLPYRFSKKSSNSGEYLLSPKDICTLSILPDILEAGVFSLKIEGRMKRPEYTAGVVRIYRKYLDLYEKKGRNGYKVAREDILELMDLYNRGGFSEGYYKNRGSASMMSTFRQNHFGTEAGKILSSKKNILTVKAMESLNKGDLLETATLSCDVKNGDTFQMKINKGMNSEPGTILHRMQNAKLLAELGEYQKLDYIKEKINGKLRIYREKPVILCLTYKNLSVTLEGPAVQEAKSMALTKESVEQQIRKTGTTSFVFQDLDIDLQEGCFLPMQAFKELRRNGIEELSKKIVSQYRRDKKEPVELQSYILQPSKSMNLHAAAFNYGQADILSSIADVSRIYLESWLMLENPEHYMECLHKYKESGKEIYIAMPYIFRMDGRFCYEAKEILEIMNEADGFLVRNLETLTFLYEQDFQKPLIADHSLYSFNQEARKFLLENGFMEDTAPLELNDRELQRRGMSKSELFVYGRVPLMLSAQCLKRTTGNCNGKKEFHTITDRMGVEFPIWNNCDHCLNIIYNSLPISLLENELEIFRLQPESVRLSFITESPQETEKITHAFLDRLISHKKNDFSIEEFTRGHFKRGVE